MHYHSKHTKKEHRAAGTPDRSPLSPSMLEEGRTMRTPLLSCTTSQGNPTGRRSRPLDEPCISEGLTSHLRPHLSLPSNLPRRVFERSGAAVLCLCLGQARRSRRAGGRGRVRIRLGGCCPARVVRHPRQLRHCCSLTRQVRCPSPKQDRRTVHAEP